MEKAKDEGRIRKGERGGEGVKKGGGDKNGKKEPMKEQRTQGGKTYTQKHTHA